MKIDKKQQKDLREQYANEMKIVWNNSERMVKFALNGVKLFMELNNYIIPFEKFNITKDFWFGYSDIGQGRSYEENNKLMEEIRKDKFKHFLSYNIQGITNKIQLLEDYINGTTSMKFYFVQTYSDSQKVAHIACREFWQQDIDEANKLTIEEAQRYHDYLNEYLTLCENQCLTYFKKYSDKITIKSYWIDR